MLFLSMLRRPSLHLLALCVALTHTQVQAQISCSLGTCDPLTVATSPHFGVFLLDRSGSMTAPVTPGSVLACSYTNRCEKSLCQVQRDLADFLTGSPNGSRARIYEFSSGSGASVRPIEIGGSLIRGWYRNDLAGAVSDAVAAAGTSTTCSGGTPLAEAICTAAGDIAFESILQGVTPGVCQFFIYSDGGENTSSAALCGGPSSTTAGSCVCDVIGPSSSYDPGSWQDNVCSRMISLLAPPLGNPCCGVVSVYAFDQFTTESLSPVFQFLQSLTRATSGAFVRVDDRNPSIPGSTQRILPATGCRANDGFQPNLLSDDRFAIGNNVSVTLDAPQNRGRLIFIGSRQRNPVNLGIVGAPNCNLEVRPFATVASGAFFLPIRNDPAIIGFVLNFQGAVLDPNGQQAPPVVLSNVLEATIAR